VRQAGPCKFLQQLRPTAHGSSVCSERACRLCCLTDLLLQVQLPVQGRACSSACMNQFASVGEQSGLEFD
jgi:hypothetical protein